MSDRQIHVQQFQGISANDDARLHAGNAYYYNQRYTYVVRPNVRAGLKKSSPKERILYPRPPQVDCSKCSARNIAATVHYHCADCDQGRFDLCLACYRKEKGCHYSLRRPRGAYIMEEEKQAEERYNLRAEKKAAPPHLLIARRYIRTMDLKSFAKLRGNFEEDDVWNLEEGVFCDNCFEYCEGPHDRYWNCMLCFGGQWGFCDACVQKGQHCTHALYPLKHRRNIDDSEHDFPQLAISTAPYLKQDTYVRVPTHTTCDGCSHHFRSAETHYHCYRCSDGDYDVCESCFDTMYAKKAMPRGWRQDRRCLEGHRMALVDFESVPNGLGYESHIRFTVSGPRGGWRKSVAGRLRRCSAIYNWFPSSNRDYDGVADGVLEFPRGAEIEEVEVLEDGWMLGVYCGKIGRFPARYVLLRGRADVPRADG